LINPELYDKCTVFIQNFPPIIINHDIIYELFNDYKILYIQLIKGKNHLYTGEAFVTFKNIEDVENIINRFNNSIPKLISELNPKVLKPLKIMPKEDYEKNKINDISNINQAQNENKIVENKNNDNIDEHFLIKINHIKDNLTLNNIKKCLEKIANPQYIDINKNEKSLILRFDSKKTSDFFVSKLKEKNYENIKDILESPVKNNEIFNNIVYVLNEKERKDYLNLVKKKIEDFKEKKGNSKNIKENHKKE
jgi:hypothetical protein